MAAASFLSRPASSDHQQMTGRPRGRVLVVDDEPTIAEIVARYLERAHYETRIAGDGHAALARVSTWHPDLVVLDLMLPGLDGLEVMRLLRESAGPRVAIILLTATSSSPSPPPSSSPASTRSCAATSPTSTAPSRRCASPSWRSTLPAAACSSRARRSR
jgi:CheY-like chemotaxis protein